MNKDKDIRTYNDKIQPHGYWEIYWTDNFLFYKTNYVNGEKHGYEEYYSDGNLCYKKFYIK